MSKSETYKRWRLANRDRLSAEKKAWYAANKDRILTHAGRYKEELKRQAYKKLGDRCVNPNCKWVNKDGSMGCTDVRCLQLDHIEGNGNEKRREGEYNRGQYRAIIAGADGYQLLCANCNWIKRVENGEVRKGLIRRLKCSTIGTSRS